MPHTVSNIELKEKVSKILASAGFTPEEIISANNAWEYAAFSEKYNHGYDRILWLLEMVKQGKVIPNSPTSTTKKGVISHIVGKRSLGYSAAETAVQLVIGTAKDQGVGITTLVDCFPTGCMGLYTEAITQKNLIGIAISHSPLRVSAFGTTDKVFGTMGHSIGFPSSSIPYIYDASVGALTNGQVMQHHTAKTPFPKDTIFTKDGKATEKPSDVFDENGIFDGIIAIAGGKDAHKISGLAGSLELLTRLALTSRDIDLDVSGYALFIALDPSFFGDTEAYKSLVDQLEEKITTARKKDGVENVYFAGQKSYNIRNKNAKTNKVLISDKTYQLLFSNH